MYNDMVFLINKYDNAQKYPEASSTHTVQMVSIPAETGTPLPTQSLEGPSAASISS